MISDAKRRALKLAHRSTIKTFGTGAVIYDKRGDIVSDGWSHFGSLNLSRYRSIHAELHAILRCGNRVSLQDATCVIATIRQKNGNITLSKPCEFCRELLNEVGVEKVIYSTPTGWRWEDVDA